MCKKVLAVLLAAVMMLSMITVSAAAAETGFSDTANHWAESAIDRWAGYGVVSGYNGAFKPNNNMTRGEFAQTMTTLLGLTEKADNKFSDLKGTEWYSDAVLKCRAAGIMMGTDGKCNATSKISRQEAFVMLGRALGIQPATSTASLSKFGDAKGIAGYAKPMLAAMVDAGYIAGVGKNSMKPASNINRASVMQIMNSTISTYIDAPGNYVADSEGIVVVNTTGEVNIIGTADGVVVAQGAEGADVVINGSVVDGAVKVDAAESTVTINSAKVDTVEVTESAENATIIVNSGSTVGSVVTAADGVSINGNGEVKDVQVEDGDKVAVNTPGTSVSVDKDAGTVTAGGETVEPGKDATTGGTGTGYVEDSGSSSGSAAPDTTSTVQFNPVDTTHKLGWGGEPELGMMAVTSYTPDSSNPTKIKASGTLRYHSGFTGFSDEVSQQSGWYAGITFTVPSSVYTLDDVIITLGGSPVKTFKGNQFSVGDNWLTVNQQVAKANGVKKEFTITVDWDGAGTDYTPTTYTINYDDVVLAGRPLTLGSGSTSGATLTAGRVEYASNVTTYNYTVSGGTPVSSIPSGNEPTFGTPTFTGSESFVVLDLNGIFEEVGKAGTYTVKQTNPMLYVYKTPVDQYVTEPTGGTFVKEKSYEITAGDTDRVYSILMKGGSTVTIEVTKGGVTSKYVLTRT